MVGAHVAGPRRLAPALWTVVAVGVAAAASVLVGSLLLGSAASRAGMDVAGVACVGLALVAILLPLGPVHGYAAARDVVRAQGAADRALVVVAGCWLAFTLVGVVFRSADAAGRPVPQLGLGEVVTWAVGFAAGRGMVLTAACAAVVLVCGVLRLRDPDRVQVRLPLVAALLGVLTPAATGHAGSATDHQLAVVTVALHAGAAALWVGGLGAMLTLVAHRRTLLDAALPRFSRLAGVCVVVVGITGIANAALRLGSWEALYGSGYGLLVLLKVVLLVLLAGLGGLARRRLAAGRTPVLRWAGAEVALMAATVGVAAALTQTA